MMFSRLRSRLWISYAVLIIVLICLMSVGIISAISSSPVLYRMEVEKLRSASVDPRIFDVEGFSDELTWNKTINSLASDYQLRVIYLDPMGVVIDDTQSNQNPSLRTFPRIAPEDETIRIIRDRIGRIWFYRRVTMTDQYSIVFAIRRPVVALRLLLRDELFQPIIISTVLALVASLVISILMGKWISNPLIKIGQAARDYTDGKFTPIELDGPREIQELAFTLNEMQQKLNDSLLSQQNFIANISHELKTPLTSIQGYAQAIIDGAANSKEKIREAAYVIHSESGRMTKLVNDLLSLAKLEGGTADLVLKQQLISSLIEATINRMEPLAQKKAITIEWDNRFSGKVLCDGDRIIQVFSNLLDNAIKFSPREGKIIITTTKQNEMLVVSFKDQGPGIAEDEIDWVFERFFQSDKIDNREENHGVGLGLTIARQIILAHKGKIWLENNPDGGSIFFISLPII